MRLAASLFLALALSAVAQAQTITGSGGTLVAPTSIGQSITVANVVTDAGTAVISCPVIGFMPSTYEWKWNCGPGSLTIDGQSYTVASGAMTLQCSGGGRAHVTTCWHNFSGQLKDGGVVTVSSKGATNNARSTVVSFAASW